MEQNLWAVLEKRIAKTIENLEKNNMQGFFVAKKEDVPAKVQELLQDGAMVAVGGSVTLAQSGVMELLRSGRYQFLDRESAATAEEKTRLQRQAFWADAFLCSANAITENGELYNVDGFGNRTAALIYGPDSVIVVAGYNKLCKDIEKASVRVKSVAAPANCVRLSCKTYCAEKGECAALAKNTSPAIASGCEGAGRICCNYVISAHQRVKNRIKVILVGEELGY